MIYSETIERKYIEAGAYNLDNLLDIIGIGQVNWIKVDIEGAEFEVVKGANNTLVNNKNIVLIVRFMALQMITDGK
jgi:FkbM family methyltransferase